MSPDLNAAARNRAVDPRTFSSARFSSASNVRAGLYVQAAARRAKGAADGGHARHAQRGRSAASSRHLVIRWGSVKPRWPGLPDPHRLHGLF